MMITKKIIFQIPLVLICHSGTQKNSNLSAFQEPIDKKCLLFNTNEKHTNSCDWDVWSSYGDISQNLWIFFDFDGEMIYDKRYQEKRSLVNSV